MAADTTPQDTYLDADGLRLHYLDWSNEAAPPMLLLHGFSGHAHTWDTFARAMSGEFYILALDQRGHGDSAWAKDSAYTVDDHASDIAAFHDHLMLDPVVLIGLSMGGRNAMMFTAIHPGKVEKLVIVDIGPDINPTGAERVRRIKVPTLIMRGSESDIFAVETAQRMHDLTPSSQFVEIQGAGHSIPADAPDAFEMAVREFLAS